jgi:hypothetical protein
MDNLDFYRRPLSPGFRGTCRQTRNGGGLPESEEGVASPPELRTIDLDVVSIASRARETKARTFKLESLASRRARAPFPTSETAQAPTARVLLLGQPVALACLHALSNLP